MFVCTYIVRGVMWVLVAGPENAAVSTWNDARWGSVGLGLVAGEWYSMMLTLYASAGR